jgi:hypothetical protein
MQGLTHSDSVANLVKALLAADYPRVIPRDAVNPYHRSRYVTHEAIVIACVAALVRAGIQVIQSPTWEAGMVTVHTLLVHASGEWLSQELRLPCPAAPRKKGEAHDGPPIETPQSVASAITYARRIGLMAVLGAAAGDEDDDGEEAERPYREPPRRDYQRDPKLAAAVERVIAPPRDTPTPEVDTRDYGPPPEVESELIARAMRGTFAERIAQATLADLSPASALGHEIRTRVKDPAERDDLRRAWDARRAELRDAEAAETEARR